MYLVIDSAGPFAERTDNHFQLHVDDRAPGAYQEGGVIRL
jgi:hypothetical protein